MIDIKLEKHKNLNEESMFYWREIQNGTLKFNRRDAEVPYEHTFSIFQSEKMALNLAFFVANIIQLTGVLFVVRWLR